MPSFDRTSAVILAFSLLPFLGRFVGISAPHADYYDESAYYCSAGRLAEGERPYQDFRLVQPPGLVMTTALGIRAGLLLPGQRVVHALSGLILAGLVFGIAGRVRDGGPHAQALAVLFLGWSPLFFTYSRTVMTDLPATILVAAAVLVVMLGRRGHLALSAALVVAGSVFRLQGLLVFAPGILVLIAVTGRARGGAIAGVKFILYAVVMAAACHGAIQLAWPRYVEDVVVLQGLRPRVGLWDRYRTVDRVVSDPIFALGLVSAALRLGGPCPRGRGSAPCRWRRSC